MLEEIEGEMSKGNWELVKKLGGFRAVFRVEKKTL